MLSKFIIVHGNFLAIFVAKSDLPEAVGPAITIIGKSSMFIFKVTITYQTK